MTYQDFIREFAPIIKVYGADHFPTMVIERIHYKTKDLTHDQIKELFGLILDHCEFAPKVPKVIELANIVRARHREGVPGGFPTEDGPRTPEVAREALATITNILSKKARK